MREISDIQAVKKIVLEQREESHSLEFKRKSVATEAALSKDDRKLLGEALSGFANATGGTLIIGIGTQNINGIDRANTLQVISNIDAVANNYRAYANDCVSPPVDGLSVKSISDDNGNGVLLIDIPRGQSRPHMSNAPGHQKYYRRVADSFVPMQHYEVEEMMRAKTVPKLTLVHRVASAGSIGGNRNVDLFFWIAELINDYSKIPVYFLHYVRRSTPDSPIWT